MAEQPQSTRDQHLALVRRAIQQVRDGGDVASTAGELASLMGVSEAHLRRVFKEMTGNQQGQYQASMRLMNSAHALRSTRDSILTVALDAGYANPESFSRAFRAAFGVSPRAYRKQHNTPQEKTMSDDVSPFSIQFVKVPVSDFERARKFYRDALGLPESFAVEAYGWARYETGGVPLCLYVVGMGGGDAEPGGDTGFHLAHPDIEQVVAKLKEAGHPPRDEIVGSDDGGRFAVVTDPDGNTFKLAQAV